MVRLAPSRMQWAGLLLVGLWMSMMLVRAEGDEEEEPNSEEEEPQLEEEEPKLEKQITGGKKASGEDFPFVVRLIIKNPKDNKERICSGSIIEERYILTAATCVCTTTKGDSIVPLENVKIGLGCVQVDKCDYFWKAEKIFVHLRYGPNGYYDIALIKTKKMIRFNMDPKRGRLIAPVTLIFRPVCNSLSDVEILTIAGFGDIKKDTSATHLMYADVPAIPDDKCKKAYPKMDEESQMCAGTDSKTSCRFDLGGPLLKKVTSTDFFLVGVMATESCSGQSGGLHQDILFFYRWIFDCTNSEGVQNCPNYVLDKVPD